MAGLTRERVATTWVPALTALAILGPFCFRKTAETDLGWHLALGRVIARSGVPFTNALCWPAKDFPWYPNTWLSDWASFELVSHFGIVAMQVLMLLCVTLTLLGVLAAGLRLDARYGGLAAPLLALLLIPRVTARPFIATWAVVAWTLWLCLPDLAEGKRDTFRRRLWCLPLIALGSNLHQGAVLATGLLAIFSVAEWLFAGRRVREIALAIAGLLALTVNPGGLKEITDTAWHLMHAGNSQLVVPILEYARPTFALAHSFFILAGLALVFAWQERRTVPGLFLSVLIFSAFGAWAMRFMYEAEIVSTPALALGFGWLARRWTSRIAWVAIATAFLALAADRRAWVATLTYLGTDWNRLGLPVDAARFIEAEHLDGHMFNSYEDGGYLEWAVPELLWFQDGRPHAFPPGFFDGGDTTRPAPEAFRQWLDQRGIEWAVTHVKRPSQHVLHTPEWALVYWDDFAEVFVRRDVKRFSKLIERLEYRHFRDTAPVLREIASAPRSELPEWTAEADRFEAGCPECARPLLIRCAVAARQGAALQVCDEAMSHTGGSEQARAMVEAARSIPVAAVRE